MPIEAMYPPLLNAACRQSKSGFRSVSIHDDTEVEINILADGRVEVTLLLGRAGSIADWSAICAMRAARNTTVTDTVTRTVTFKPR